MQILIICLELDATMSAPAEWESFLRHLHYFEWRHLAYKISSVGLCWNLAVKLAALILMTLYNQVIGHLQAQW